MVLLMQFVLELLRCINVENALYAFQVRRVLEFFELFAKDHSRSFKIWYMQDFFPFKCFSSCRNNFDERELILSSLQECKLFVLLS
ncbi:hypothetical protein Hdeb2414_s0002g00068541 [Helianthus debilis subsp. tardiflorus]